MTTDAEHTSTTPSKLLHETIDQLSTIISIAQFSLITEELSPKTENDFKRIIQTARDAAEQIKQLSEMIREGE